MLDLIKIREELHQIPELGFKEFKTVEYLLSVLHKFENVRIHIFDFPAIVAEYQVNDLNYKLFRADMDALPITEQTGCDYESKYSGLMHACGHDIHMAILLGLIEKVVAENLQQNLLFVFQPAEEGLGGAQKMLNTNFFDSYQIKECYALHVNGDLPVGTISSKPGVFFANTRELEVTFKGLSAHVAFPEKGKNALDAGVDFYQKLKKILLENFPVSGTVICGLGKMESGTVMNAVPDYCTFHGTIRAFTDQDHQKLKSLVEDLAKGVATEHDLDSEVIWHAYYKEVNNSTRLFDKLTQRIAKSEYKLEYTERVFTGEDFGFFADRYPGLLFWLGANQGESQDLHSAKFLPSADAIKVGVKILAKMV